MLQYSASYDYAEACDELPGPSQHLLPVRKTIPGWNPLVKNIFLLTSFRNLLWSFITFRKFSYSYWQEGKGTFVPIKAINYMWELSYSSVHS